MEYRHFITALLGGVVVVVACFAEFGINAPTVIFANKWALVCSAWFMTTLPGINSFMRTTVWFLLMGMLINLGVQIPYMFDSLRVGHAFCQFMITWTVFIFALMVFAHTREQQQCEI